jgi:glycosyltransferase involved in cell wall biosynthesis
MKILMIADNLGKGGKERRLVELLRFFDRMPIKIALIILKDEIAYPNIYNFVNTELIVIKRKIKKDPTVFLSILKICSEFNPDIIHCWGSMPSVYALPSKIFFRKPLINAMIADAKCDKTEKVRASITFPLSTVILSNSKAGLIAYCAPERKARVIHNGFNYDRLQNVLPEDEIKMKYQITTRFVVGMIAAFYPRKDFETYLAVADQISAERDDVTFLAIGDGILRPKYERAYKDNGKIVFTGNVNHVESLIQILDVGVLMSNSQYHLEGISNSILETMAFGKPVIASRGGGTDEIIADGKNGLLIDPFSSFQLKDGIQKLLNNDSLRIQLGCSAKEQIQKNFSIDSMCIKTYELYKAILNHESIVD